MEKKLEDNKDKIIQLCKKYGVKSVYIFGSAAFNTVNAESDYDFLVTFSNKIDPVDYADNYFELLKELETMLGRKVDLVTEKSLKNPILIEEIKKTRIPLYEAA